MVRSIILFVALLSISNNFYGQSINWVDISEVEELVKNNPKPVFMDIYTSWCGWCKRLDQTTFKDPQIVQYLNQNYYAVKYNAERKDTVLFQGKEYINRAIGKSRRPTHDLTRVVMKGSSGYPTMVVFDKELNLDTKVNLSGFRTAQQLAPLLVYLKEELNKVTAWPEFNADFDSTFCPGCSQEPSKKVNWVSFQEALEMNTKPIVDSTEDVQNKKRKKKKKSKSQTEELKKLEYNPKKIVLLFSEENNLLCKMMEHTVYSDSSVLAELLNGFHVVRFDLRNQDSLKFDGHTFVNNPEDGPYHQFGHAVYQQLGYFKLPGLLFIDENNKVINPLFQYLDKKLLPMALQYYSSNQYKNITLQQFIQGKRMEMESKSE